jgi:arginine repressor
MRLKESEMIELLQNESGKFAPLSIKSITSGDNNAEAFIEFFIADGPYFKAFVEIMPVATPKMISSMVQFFRGLNDKEKIPLLVVPYMGSEQTKILQREGISWIDLCGNMMIKVGNKIYIERTGKKNLFPDTSPIKKIFEGTSSLVSRALLLKKEPFRSLYEVVNFINERNGNITLSTVSKIISSLEEGLLITKTEAGISVTNREKLLDSVLEGYIDYTRRNKSVTYTFAIPGRSSIFSNFFSEEKVDYAVCGFSAAQLKNLATTNRTTVFIKSINEARKAFERNNVNIKPDTEFGQLDLIETRNPCVWFNVQGKPDYSIVDDIELYLEMMIDTPRGPKVAEMLKERILKGQE